MFTNSLYAAHRAAASRITGGAAAARQTGAVDTVISVAGLVKRFGSTLALDGLDLEVDRGEVHGFLGPNGAGKSTTVRVLLGLLRADGGTVRMLGGDPWRDAVALHRRITYVPGEVSLWPNLSGGEVIDLVGRMRGGVNEARRRSLIERFELDPRKSCRSYSKGNRQKVALVAGLCAEAELLLLDEPTSGLDPIMEAEFQQVVREERAAGRTVLLSSHILAEVEALCDRVSIIREGRTVSSGTLAELRRRALTTVVARVRGSADAVLTVPGVVGARVLDGELTCEVESQALDGVLLALAAAGVESLVAHPPTLEELFLAEYDDPGGPGGVPRHERLHRHLASWCAWPCAGTGSGSRSGCWRSPRSPTSRPWPRRTSTRRRRRSTPMPGSRRARRWPSPSPGRRSDCTRCPASWSTRCP